MSNNNYNWSTTSSQYVIESKMLKAKKIDNLIKAINKYINSRPANIGDIQETGSWYFVKVDILSFTYTYTYTYVQPTIQYTYNSPQFESKPITTFSGEIYNISSTYTS